MPIKWEGSQPPARVKRGKILKILNSTPKQLVCLSVSPYGQWTHWFGGRSDECKQDYAKCVGCQKGWPSRFKVYLHVAAPGEGRFTWVELTREAIDTLTDQIPQATSLRGVQFRISKTKGGAHGRFLIEVLERVIPESELDESLDPKELLNFLWSCKRPARQEQEQ